MNQVAWQIFGGSELKPNTFIGGVASTITTSGALATKLEIASNRITNFKIVGSDIECRISGSYVIPDSAFISDTSITYYYDYENCTLINYRAFRDCTNLSEVVFDNVTYIDSQAFYKSVNLKKAILKSVITIGYQAFDGDGIISKLSTLYAPNCTILGGTIGFDFVFRNQLNVIFYCHPSLATNNAGAPDGDITNTAFSNKVIPRYVTNYTPPSSITNLSVGNVYGTAVQLNFTAPSSTNAIDYYEVWQNGVNTGKRITASGEYIVGLTLNTAYTFQLIPVDIFFNKSTSNTIAVTTMVTSSVPTTGLVSYYKLDSNSNDIYGSNNGTDTNVSYVSGKVSNAASYNGTTSKTVIGNPANLQLSTGSVSCWIKTSAAGSSYRAIFSKENAYGLFLVDGVLGFYNWGSFGGSGFKSTGVNLNDNLWHNLVLVFESSTANNYIYVDGVLKLTFSMSVLNQSNNLLIGLNSTSQYINALIDETPIYNTKLTQTEIDLIYNSGNGTTL